MITIERKVEFRRGGPPRRRGRDSASAAPAGRVARISRLMALAIRLDQLIRDGVVNNRAELARLGHVSRSRVTQLLNLLFLAPDIQEALLFLPAIGRGRDAVTERNIRPIAAISNWDKQRQAWQRLAGPMLSLTSYHAPQQDTKFPQSDSTIDWSSARSSCANQQGSRPATPADRTLNRRDS